MHQFPSHIKELLAQHDCVILPGLGGFVSAELPAKYDAKSQRFLPPSKTISFNESLSYNDGLLCQSIMKAKRIDFKSAQEIVDREAEEIKNIIIDGVYRINGVGELYRNDGKRLAFKPSTHQGSIKQGFGLNDFYFPTLSEHSAEKRMEQVPQTHPVSSLSRWMAAAAIFLMLLLFSRPTSQFDTQHAGMGIDLDTIFEEMPVQSKGSDDLHEDRSLLASNEIASPTANEKHWDASVKLVSKPLNNKTYHVIIASLTERSQADLFTLNYCLGQFDNYQILESGNRYRVSIKTFRSKEEALPYLEEIRSMHPLYADAWLLSL